MKIKLMPLILAFFFISFGLFAQQNRPAAILEYYDNDMAIQVIGSDGEALDDLYFGFELEVGDTVKTNSSNAEIRISNNGSILKLARNTTFTISNIQGVGGSPVTEFTIISGKLRTIAARTGTGDQQYLVNTPAAVCGVRGTDFTVDVQPGNVNSLIVKSGLVEFIDRATGRSLSLGAGMFADTFAAVFEAVQLTAEQLAEYLEEMDFTTLDPNQVPGQTPQTVVEEPDTTEEPDTIDTTPVAPPVLPTEPSTEVASDTDSKPSFLDPIMEKLRDFLGMEIGSVTIDGTTYAKAVLQPTFSIGKLKMSLYLPIIYSNNMFDPADWYKPSGNNEWSFGTDEEFAGDWMAITKDVVSDLFLKIRYVQWGEQRDKFFLKVGNLNNMTIGHGLLMYNYANDADFPAIRRVGLNTGFDFNKFGFEAVVNDLADPQIFGGRVYFRPVADVFRFALGFSAIADLYPASVLPEADREATGEPVFINVSADLDFPIFENDILSVIVFGDIGGMMPYLRSEVGGIPAGLYYQALYSTEPDFSLRNWGLAAGFFGNILIADYRLEYRNFNGAFRPNFFNNRYDRMRGIYAQELAYYLNNQDDPIFDVNIQGIYGETGFSFYKDKIRFAVGYMAPFSIEEGKDASRRYEIFSNDILHAEFSIGPDVIPVINIHGSISMDRTGFVSAFMEEEALIAEPEKDTLLKRLFDERTVIRGEVIYPVAPTLDLAAIITTNTVFDDEGSMKMSPSITIETRIHF